MDAHSHTRLSVPKALDQRSSGEHGPRAHQRDHHDPIERPHPTSRGRHHAKAGWRAVLRRIVDP
jgi:hypothetical protein